MQYLKIITNYKSQFMKIITLFQILIFLSSKLDNRLLNNVWFILCPFKMTSLTLSQQNYEIVLFGCKLFVSLKVFFDIICITMWYLFCQIRNIDCGCLQSDGTQITKTLLINVLINQMQFWFLIIIGFDVK